MTRYNIQLNETETLNIKIDETNVNILVEKIMSENHVEESTYKITNIATKNIAQINYSNQTIVTKKGNLATWLLLLILGIICVLFGFFLVLATQMAGFIAIIVGIVMMVIAFLNPYKVEESSSYKLEILDFNQKVLFQKCVNLQKEQFEQIVSDVRNAQKL